MRATLQLLRGERRARLFFAAHAQSSIGTGAAYIGVLILAFDRLPSPWAISVVLLAEFLPAMLLGPIFGAAADRWSRRACAVAADVLRGVAFVGIALVDDYVATVALALVAGTGTGLYLPAVLSGLPGLVSDEQIPAATALYGALDDVGHTLGPALAAGALLLAGPETIMTVNGVTFMLSAVVLTQVPLGGAPTAVPDQLGRRASLLAEARSGLGATARMPEVRTIISASALVILFAGMFNVGELLLAREELGSSEAAFSILVAVFGAGVIAGSLAGSRGGSPAELRRRWSAGLVTLAIGCAVCGLAPAYGVAVAGFAVAGVGNGLVLVHERLFVQRTVPRNLLGRVFGVRDALGSWAFALAFLSAGVLLTVLGTRALFLVAAAGVLLVLFASLAAGRYAPARAGLAVPDPPPLRGEEREVSRQP